MILKTQKELENYNLVNRVFHLDKDTYLFGGLECNVAQPYTALRDDYERPDFMKFDDINRIHDVIVRMADQSKFIRNEKYVDVFSTVLNDPQFLRKAGVTSNDSMILDDLVKRGWWPPTPESVSQIIIDLWNQLADNSTYSQDKAETDRRNAQIAEMTGNGQHGFTVQIASEKFKYDKFGRKYDPMAGQTQGNFSRAISGPWSRGVNSRGFVDLSSEEVQNLYDAWKTTTAFRHMKPEELRNYVRNAGPTDVFGKNVRVPSAVSDPTDRLHHPVTDEAFNQKSLIRYINGPNPYAGRELITRNGRVVPRLKELFEKTVRGELE